MESLVDKIVGSVDVLSHRVGKLEKEFTSHVAGAEGSPKLELRYNVQLPPYERPQVRSHSPPLSAKSQILYPHSPSQYRTPGRRERDRHDTAEEEEEEEEEGEEGEVGDPVSLRKPSIPVNHTTGAARLLLVQPIAELVRGIITHDDIKNENYPMIQEERRGVLRLFGRGKGLDRLPGYEKNPMADYGSDSTPSDTSSDVSSPVREEWAQLGGLIPAADDTSPSVQRGNVIDSEGMPDLRRETVLRYVESFNKHLNIMHPILIPRHLNALVENFLKSIPASYAKPSRVSNLTAHASVIRSPTASFIGSSRNPESAGQKRKRSPVTIEESLEIPSTWDHKPCHLFRSIGTALVLLVMALGEICEYPEKIPDIPMYQNDDQSVAGSPQTRSDLLRYPAQTSPTLSAPTGLPSPQDGDRMHSRGRRTSLDGGPFFSKNRNPKAKNDIFPGLPYFALATDIIDNELGGNSLQHVHSNILAGLYHGQLGRVLESHTYIHNACRSLQVILRP
jgi:hypothetical protein